MLWLFLASCGHWERLRKLDYVVHDKAGRTALGPNVYEAAEPRR